MQNPVTKRALRAHREERMQNPKRKRREEAKSRNTKEDLEERAAWRDEDDEHVPAQSARKEHPDGVEDGNHSSQLASLSPLRQRETFSH